MLTEVAVGHPERVLQMPEVRPGNAGQHRQDPEPDALMNVVVEPVDRMFAHRLLSRRAIGRFPDTLHDRVSMLGRSTEISGDAR